MSPMLLANLGNHEVIVILLAEQLHVALDLVGDARHHLDGFAEIIATTLLVDDCLVDTTSGERIRFRSLNAGESLVVSEVQVGLTYHLPLRSTHHARTG